jgi:hypothetical protein
MKHLPRMSGIYRSATEMALTILFCVLAHAQTFTGNISGTVSDSSGAVVPGASIAATNVQTGVRTSATSNSVGVNTIRFLPTGQYKVSVQANGFQTMSFPVFTLEVDQTVRLDAQLKVGDATETVEILSSLAPILNTTDSSLAFLYLRMRFLHCRSMDATSRA